MSVTSVEKNFDDLSLTFVADFDAPVEQVWQLWADPRQLERWWGPPGYPATVEHHDLTPGGEVTYYMTGPEGERHRGWWRVLTVDPPVSLEILDGFADEEGRPAEDLPTTTMHVRLTPNGRGTRMEIRSVYDSREQMQQVLDMGVVEGMSATLGQVDAVLAG